MIPYFPTPYPDESFYSVIARLANVMQYTSDRLLLEQLFGDRNTIATIGFPTRLEYLIDILPPGHSYTSEYFIAEHTHLPFFELFLPAKRLEQVKSDMRQDRGKSIHMRIGLMASRVPLPAWLRYCPICVDEDRQKYESCYWHRIHQLPGVLVCPTHRIPLQDSNISTYNRTPRYALIATENAIPRKVRKKSLVSSKNNDILQNIALDAEWLLKQQELKPDLLALRQRYLYLLTKLNLATYTGSINASKFSDAFQDFYSKDVLNLLNCDLVVEKADNWLLRLVHKSNIAQHPLHHLLLIQFLGFTAESFFKGKFESVHFGQDPWPCLNKTCIHHYQNVITTCEIHFSKDSRRPVGTFRCDECGFEYSRLGPDTSPPDCFRLSRIEDFGPVWVATLRRLWPDDSVSLRELGRRLGVTTKTVQRQAVKLELDFPRPGSRGGKIPIVNDEATRQSETKAIEEICEEKRQIWLEMLAAYPEANTKKLRDKCPAIYTWLYRHDRTWLMKHKPTCKKSVSNSGSQVDWVLRDIQLAVKSIKAALNLLQSENRPKQITFTALATTTGERAVIQQHSAKLPTTTRLLSRLSESREEFAIRRIWWTANRISKTTDAVSRWHLIKQSGTERVKDWPEVQDELNKALTWLEGQTKI